jgi:integrase
MQTKDWIEAFREDWLDRGAENFYTWTNDYERIFQRLPQDEPLSAEALHIALKTTEVNTRQRVRACTVLNALARFAKVDYDALRYRGKYNYFNPKTRRILPTDETIVQTYSKIEDSHWQWVFAMMATYGLRNHEVFLLDLDSIRNGDEVITVLDGKTGTREVFPFPPEWWYEMKCYRPLLPDVDLTRDHSALGRSVTKYFRQPRTQKRDPLPFKPYDLRHRFAIRTLEYGLEPTLAAQQMGHSLAVHNGIYKKWITRDVHQRAYDRILQNPDRPQAQRIPQSQEPSGIQRVRRHPDSNWG